MRVLLAASLTVLPLSAHKYHPTKHNHWWDSSLTLHLFSGVAGLRVGIQSEKDAAIETKP
jgi:hypothetical protein